MTTGDPRQLSFISHGTRCDAWFFEPAGLPGGVPAVVMAHGFGGTKDSGLAPFARALRDAGLAVLAFDYRGFGGSEGEPRQRVSVRDQMDDYRAAIAAAGAQPGVDPGRIVLWGISMGAGHVLNLAADRTDLAAVIAVVPLVSGPAAGRVALAQNGPGAVARSAVTTIRGAVASRFGGSPVLIPLVGRPGEEGALTAPGYYEDYLALSGPTWRNEVDAAVGVEMGAFRAGRHADRIQAPVLMQIADFDQAAPPYAAAKVGFKARAEVRHYPCDHFGLFPGHPGFDAAVAHQIRFLQRHVLGETAVAGPVTQEVG
ncbi:alpha/beta hydrolase [Nocardia sp. alder85J]|uniref:alpha/beta hydrolase n=1 Tax=Nocardia sp. alder85J TaxID=2862949 RepID=UPI001CD69CCB|nr:alpha/beta fold hydrolase [Nocardia sp. alder85J]MCX4095860.1 alpha/beta fold hydrolase [Nocardia sp. alder85J]